MRECPVLLCRSCKARQDIHLHEGRLYCLDCLPLGGLNATQRYEMLRRRHNRRRAAAEARRR